MVDAVPARARHVAAPTAAPIGPLYGVFGSSILSRVVDARYASFSPRLLSSQAIPDDLRAARTSALAEPFKMDIGDAAHTRSLTRHPLSHARRRPASLFTAASLQG